LKAAREGYGYLHDYDDDLDVDYDSDDMDMSPARPTTTPIKSMHREDEFLAAPPSPIDVPEEILGPMTHYNEDNDGGGHDQDHICHDDEGLPVPDDTEDHKREVLAETTPVDGHEVEEGTSSLLETYDDDIDDVDTLMGSKNDDTGYIPLTTPTKQEAAMEQESEEGMEDVRTKTTMNMDPMAVKEKGEMTLYATNKKAVVFPLAYPPIILRVKFSAKPVTSFMAKDIIRARISKTLHHDFSPKTCKDVSTQDLEKYMDWLCGLRLILMISLHYFPP
jgi:hypothetical protein